MDSSREQESCVHVCLVAVNFAMQYALLDYPIRISITQKKNVKNSHLFVFVK